MDTGKGILEIMKLMDGQDEEEGKKKVEAKHPNHGGWFHEGELIEIKGSVFKITRITPTKLTLKLQKRG